MTLPVSTRRNDYTGTAAVHIYAYTFKIFNQADIKVIVADTNGVETTLTLTTDYTVSSVGVDAGGNITLVSSGQAWLTGGELKTGYHLTALGNKTYLQELSIRNQGAYYPNVVEDQFDKLGVLIQQLNEKSKRAIKFVETSTDTDISVPSLEDNAGKIIAVNDDEDGFEYGPTVDSISSDSAAASAAAAAAAASAASASASESSATTSAGTATTQAAAAAASTVAAAASVAALSATSTTSLAVGTGAKTFTTQAGKLFVAGQYLQIASNASALNFMHGTVTSYSGTSLVMNITDIGGSGTLADWNISISGTQGTIGATGLTGSSGAGLTAGGTANQGLTKINGTDYNTQWSNVVHSDGLSGGQTIKGSTLASENVTITSTNHATKGKILLGAVGAIAEATSQFVIGGTTPSLGAIIDGIGTTGGIGFPVLTDAQRNAITFGRAGVLFWNSDNLRFEFWNGSGIAVLSPPVLPLSIVNGGTGDDDAPGARTNLGIGTGDSPQFAGVNVGAATDTTITRVSAGVIAVEGSTVLLASGVGSVTQAWDAQLDSLSSATANGVSLVTAADYAAMKALLDLEIGTDVQAYDAQLSSLIRQNSQSAAYTTVLADGGKHILHPSADTTARIFTIAANASVAYPIGTALTFVNQNSGGVITIAITSDTMRLAGAGTTGSRTLAANGIATALKITSTEWIISGTGLT